MRRPCCSCVSQRSLLLSFAPRSINSGSMRAFARWSRPVVVATPWSRRKVMRRMLPAGMSSAWRSRWRLMSCPLLLEFGEFFAHRAQLYFGSEQSACHILNIQLHLEEPGHQLALREGERCTQPLDFLYRDEKFGVLIIVSLLKRPYPPLLDPAQYVVVRKTQHLCRFDSVHKLFISWLLWLHLDHSSLS